MKKRHRTSRRFFGKQGRSSLNLLHGDKQRKRRSWIFERLEDRLVFSVEPTGTQLLQTVSYSSNTLEGAIATAARETEWASLQNAYANPNQALNVQTLALPSDPLFADQWHLLNVGQETGNPDLQNLFGVAGQDINVVPVWNLGIDGSGVLVAVIDSGVQVNHPDLAGNISPTLRLNPIDGTNNVGPDLFDPDSGHGTSVAGIIAAVDNNGIGGVGIAPGATIVPIKLIADGSTVQAELDAFEWAINNGIDITNNSWKPIGTNPIGIDGLPVQREAVPLSPAVYQILRSSAIYGRDGLGMINVFSSGNNAGPFFTDVFGTVGNYDSSSYNAYANSRYVITVTGVDHDGLYINADGTFTTYPEIGPNVLVAAPTGSNGRTSIASDDGYGSGIWTTDLTGDLGFNAAPLPSGFDPDNDPLDDPNYTSRFNGTSASAPMVSGVIALMLQANPNLTYRDVQEILVRSSRQVAQFESPSSGANSSVYTSKNTWIVNQTQPFREVDSFFNPLYVGPVTGFLNPIADPGTDGFYFPFDFYALDSNDTNRGEWSQYEPQPDLFTNGAGYTVSQGYGIYGDAIGYGHGEIDAELAVTMAKQWNTLSQNIAPATERTFTTGIINQGPNTGWHLPHAEHGSTNPGIGFIVPGGIGGGNGFIPYYDEFFQDEPFKDYTGPGAGARGASYIDFAVPPSEGIDVEWVEVRVEFDGPPEDLDFLRLFLTSPDGTQSELNHFFGDPETFAGTYSVQETAAPPALINPVGNINNSTGGQFLWTWSTNRHWGESTNNAVIVHPATGEPLLQTIVTSFDPFTGLPLTTEQRPIFRNWELHIENWSSSDYSLPIVEVVWHGKPITGGSLDPNYASIGATSAQRIQGFVGIDTNGDEAFNYSRYIQTVNGTHTDVSTLRTNDIQRRLDFVDTNGNGILDYGIDSNGKLGPLEQITQEPFAANVVVQARRVFSGVVETVPVAQFLTGADGNYYFDLNIAADKAYAASIGATLEYEISIVDPEGRAVLEDIDTPLETTSNPQYTYLQHYKQKWLISPDWFFAPDRDNSAATIQDNPGDIFFDPATNTPVPYTNNGLLAPMPMNVQNINFLVKQNTPPQEFDVTGTVYSDLNGNGVFDADDSAAANVFVYVDVNRSGSPDPGEERTLTDEDGKYTLTIHTDHDDTYQIGVIPPTNNWLPTDAGHDGVEAVFAGPGSTVQTIDFFLLPPNVSSPDGGTGPGTIRGVVFNDLDNNGTRGALEAGIPNIRVFIDANANGAWDSATEVSQLTASNGSYSFSNVAPGTIRIDIVIADEGTPAAFWALTTPSLGYFSIDLGPGGSVSGFTFGLKSRADSDWGDLPDSYGTYLASNGPRHFITGGFQLGPSIDGEVNGIPTANASGEGITGDDDDGVVIVSNGGVLRRGENTLRVTVQGVGGLLTGWMDFNADGHFDESERLTWKLNGANLGGEADINPGTWDLTVTIPSTAVEGQMASRFRWGEQGLSFLGPALVGEVEDYMFSIVSLIGDYNRDGFVDQADYNVWRAQKGQNVSPLTGADGNSDGVVDQTDYDVWRAHYGESLSSGAGALSADSGGASSLVAAAAFDVDTAAESTNLVNRSFAVQYTTYGPSGHVPAVSTLVSPTVAVPAMLSDAATVEAAFGAYVVDAEPSLSSNGTAEHVQSTPVVASGEGSNLLLVDLAMDEHDGTKIESVDESLYSGEHQDDSGAGELALAAALRDEDWWSQI